MTWQAVVGLLGLHAALVGVGLMLVWGGRGLATAAEAARLGGVGYLVGTATYGLASVLALVVGIPYRLPTIAALLIALALSGLALGLHRRRPLPSLRGPSGAQPLSLAAAPFVALLVVFLEATFRRGRLEPLIAYDAWAFWVPKGQVIHAYGGLQEDLFAALPNVHPLLVPALEATAFSFMGSADRVTLALFWWGLFVGFVWAVGGLLAPRVRPLLLWPVVLALVVSPTLLTRALHPKADVPLDWFLAVGSLLLVLWVLERRPATLAGAAVLLSAATVTKREGVAFALCAVVAATVATWPRRRAVWPSLALLAGCVALASVPWRIWFMSRGFPSDAPGAPFLETLDRAWPAIRLALGVVLDPDVWLPISIVGLVAVVLAVLAGRRALPAFVLTYVVLALLVASWGIWAFPEIPFTREDAFNPIVRVSGAVVLVLGALTPLLLEQAWAGRAAPARRRDRHALAAVAAVAIAYPAVALAGGVTFPIRDACVRPAGPDTPGELELVYGRFDSQVAAEELRARVVGVGFVGTEVVADGCGRWKVTYDGVESYEAIQGTIEEARAQGFDPRVEVEAP